MTYHGDFHIAPHDKIVCSGWPHFRLAALEAFYCCCSRCCLLSDECFVHLEGVKQCNRLYMTWTCAGHLWVAWGGCRW